jgi:UDP-GlcNAc:undecaprenyl-phosphate/decaprenyl-phosphate GlcNAc-1-phosphate transferase
VPETLAARAGAVLVLTCVLVPVALALLRRADVLDHPTSRSSHHRPTPRGGGIAPAAAVVGAAATTGLSDRAPASALLWSGLLVAATAFAGIGLCEDVRGVSPLRRLGAQLTAGTLAAALLVQAAFPAAPLAVAGPAALALGLWLTAYANCFNFIDGVDGISGVSVVVAGATWFAVARVENAPTLAAGGLFVAAAALGFLPYNFPRARIFLGDAGSYFFGSSLAALVVVGAVEGVRLDALLAPLVLPLADAGFTLLNRVLHGRPWNQAHREHVYQHLVSLGWSHARVTAVFGGLLALCSALGAVAAAAGPGARVAAWAAVGAVAAGYLAAPRLVVTLGRGAGRVPARAVTRALTAERRW